MQGSFFGTGRADDKLVETDMLEFNASWVYLWENTFQEKIKFFSGVASFWTFFPPSWNFSAWLWWLVGRMAHGEVRPPHSHVGGEVCSVLNRFPWENLCLPHGRRRSTEWDWAVSAEDFCISVAGLCLLPAASGLSWPHTTVTETIHVLTWHRPGYKVTSHIKSS